LLTDAYQRRDRVGLIVFRSSQAVLALPPTNSVDLAQKLLTDLPIGGKTPLASGLWLALRTIEREWLRFPELMPLLIILTDGAGNVSLGDHPPQAEAYQIADRIRETKIHAVVVNMENQRFDTGLAQALANHLDAPCHNLATLKADALVQMVRSELNA
jgi:magnesium chelatase subunit D